MLIDLATHGMFAHCLDVNSVVLDLGANCGEFSKAMIERFGCTVIAVEPNPNVFQFLNKVSGVRAICAAIAPDNGTTTLNLNANSQASTLLPVAESESAGHTVVECITYATLLERLGVTAADLLKIDIEGYEVALIDSMSDHEIRSISQISIELHDFNGMITTEDADRIESRLQSLGFNRIPLSRVNRENVLFYQPSRCRVGPLRHLWARYITRNLLGIRRIRSRFKSDRFS